MSVKEYKLSPQALVMVQGSSRGTQPKYYGEGYWHKLNNLGYEGLAEYLVSRVLSCSDKNLLGFLSFLLYRGIAFYDPQTFPKPQILSLKRHAGNKIGAVFVV